MKKRSSLRAATVRILSLLGLGALFTVSTSAQTTWTGGGGDGNWNNADNWDFGVPTEGVPGIIGAGNTVDYNAPMAATSFGGLASAGIVNINAAGFLADGTGDGVIGFAGSGARLFLNSGAVVGIAGGGLSLSNAAGLSVASGATLSVGGNLLLGRNATGNTGFATNQGGTITATATQINPNNNSSSSLLVINGGVNDLGTVVVKRSSAAAGAPGLGTEGLTINNGLVRMTSLDLGGNDGNSWLTLLHDGGVVTNSGAFMVRGITASRASRFFQRGGLFVSEGVDGVNLYGHGANNSFVFYSVTGGTNLVNGFVLGNPAGTDLNGTVRLTNAAKIYIGSAGMSSVGTLNTKTIVLNPTGTFGAQAHWSGTEPIILAGGAFDCANLAGAARNITLSGVLSGVGNLNKIGGGTLTLEATNTYSGNTFIEAGTLALAATGSISNTPQIIVAGGATYDVSAVAGFTLGAARTLGGLGTVVGDVAVASGGIISPGPSPDILTLANSLTLSGSGIIHFELPTTPGTGNDRLVVNGDLNVSGANTIEIAGGGPAGTVHALIQYGGNFSGNVGNFTIAGASGILSNNASLKTIYLVVQSSVRTPGNVAWVGNSLVNDWDTVNRTNWVNSGTSLLDYFVTGDNARFDATGAANPIINLVGNNAPATVTVDATANYTFGGLGAISGTATLVKTNSGTLTVTAGNTYTGPTIIGGGVLEAATLANAGSPSGIGAAAADPGNLVFNGGTLRYPGTSVSTDRGATFGEAGGTIQVSDIGSVLTANGTLIGPGVLTKSGPGTLLLNAGNSHGGMVISGGTLRLDAANAAGSGGITNLGSTLVLAGPSVSGAITHPNTMNFTGVSTVDLNNYAGNSVLDGAWSGDGLVNIINQQSSARVFTVGGNGAGGGHLWDFSGTINMGDCPGDLRFNDGGGTGSGPNFGSSNAVFNLGNSTARLLVRNGGTITQLGELRGGPSTRLSGRGSSAGIATYRIGGRNTAATFEGSIVDTDTGTGQLTAIVKVGSGKWTLTGNSTHTSTTTVEEGILQVDGSLGNTAVFVNGGTLAGNGSIAGTVDVQSGGTLSPGGSPGTLTINNTLSLMGHTVIEVNKGVGNDLVNVNGTLFYGGTLTVNNVGGPLSITDEFYVFNTLGHSGDFWAIQGSPGPGLAWAFDPDTGKVSVVAGAPVLIVNREGNNLVFSWTGANLKLQAQTNSLSVGISNNWGDYPGGGSTGISVPINVANGTVFFRLVEKP